LKLLASRQICLPMAAGDKKRRKQKDAVDEGGEAAAAAHCRSSGGGTRQEKKEQQQSEAEDGAASGEKRAKKEKKKKVEREAAVATDAGEAEPKADRKKAKKRKREEAEEEAKEQPADAKESEEPKNIGRKAKKRARQAALAAMDGAEQTEEAKRRQAQRELQQLILRLRKEGKTEAEIKKAKMDMRTNNDMAPESSKELKKKEWMEWMQSDTADRKKKDNLEHKHDLVIIPIAWRGRHDKIDVDKAADDIKACVAQQKIDVWIDGRRQLTPGQKFAHWEHRGVMLRVEVGPEDLKKGECRVCLAKTPGDHKSVQRKNVRMPPAGARKLLLLLKEWGLSKLEIEKREGDDESDDEADARKAKKPDEQDDDDLAGNYAPRESKAGKDKTKNKKKR